MKDRLSKYPGRVKLTPVAGQADTFDMIRADEPENEGTPINKQTLLTDETAEKLGLDPADNPTPDQALAALAYKEGDIKETVRTDLGDRWVLCNGDIVPEGELPELRDLLFYNTSWRGVRQPSFEYDTVRPTRKPGEWVMFERGEKTAAVYDAATDTLTEITCPTMSAQYGYGIFGLTWDGTRYILGVLENPSTAAGVSGSAHLYTSTNLKSWTKKYSFVLEHYQARSTDLSSDGENILVLSSNGSDSTFRVDAVNKEMTAVTKMISRTVYSGSLVHMPDGYWAVCYPSTTSGGSEYYVTYVYRRGEKSNALLGNSGVSGAHGVAFFGNQYMMTVRGDSNDANGYGPYQTSVADLTTGTQTALNWKNITKSTQSYCYLQYCEYDRTRREWTYFLKDNAMSYYAAYISEDDNPSVAANYRVEAIDALPERIYNDQMSPDRAVLHDVVLRDPNLKCLPESDGDAYKYIYIGGDDK